MIWLVIAVVFLAGAAGGFVNVLVSGELKLPHRDSEAGVWRPGWIGNVLAGGAAGSVSWGLYGSLSEFEVIGGVTATAEPALVLSELFAAVLVGFGGGRWLSAEIQRIVAVSERDALDDTKRILTRTIRDTTS